MLWSIIAGGLIGLVAGRITKKVVLWESSQMYSLV
ncbi:hypothetical protein D8849_08730 [Streptococcus mitis]|uniref:GlsB/YeaQ/YmgE family stress response membrane protein n=1 Tax=Streptococcus mitis TaxID=28037 RepID=A0A428D085_STRMT|nr:hypothetical protein D8849_08730 [Streptococcus mitis]